MRNIAIVNAIGISSYALSKLDSGLNSLEMALDFGRKLPDVVKRVCLTDRKLETGVDFEHLVKRDWSVAELLASFSELSTGFTHIFYYYADCPFLSNELANKMYQNHLRYFADYSFADGYPYGLTPEILKVDVLAPLKRLLGEDRSRIERGSLFDIIKKDINSFDIETEISPEDLRLLRITLNADTRRNYILIKHIAERAGTSYSSVLKLLKESPQILRTLPAFFNIQIVEGCPQNCSYCPYPNLRDPATGKLDEMPIEKFGAILKEIERFCEEGTISISLWGEPAYHSRIVEIAVAVLKGTNLDLLIETSGIGWQDGVFERVKAESERSPTWIISLDAWDQEVYSRLRGEGYQEAVRTARKLQNLFPDSTYVQAVRMRENEDDLEQFYRNWRSRTDKLIIQKYDHFCSHLSDRRVTDLSPLKRFPCWHTKRDMYILFDGRVSICREDIDMQHVLGNIFEDEIEKIWNKGLEIYQCHISLEYPSICKDCDEYYTYNF